MLYYNHSKSSEQKQKTKGFQVITMNSKKVLKGSVAMILSAMVMASATTMVTTGVADMANVSVSAASVTTEPMKITSFTASNPYNYRRVGQPIKFDMTVVNAVLQPNTLYYYSYSQASIVIKDENGKVVEDKLDLRDTPMPKKDTWTPVAAGKYTATLTVRDWKSNVWNDSTNSFYENQVATATITFEVVDSRIKYFGSGSYENLKGETMQFSSITENVGMHYGMYRSYVVTIKKGDEVVATLDDRYARAEYMRWTPTEGGSYTATLKLVDYYGFELPEYTTSFAVRDPRITSFTVSPASPIVNQEATFKSTRVDAKAMYGRYSKYEITVKKGNEVVATLSDPYAGDLKWTPTQTGTYTATLNVRDFYGYQLPTKTITFKVVNALAATPSFTKKTITLGQTVTPKLTAKNGAGSYKYAFYYKKSGTSTWTTVHGFNTTNTASIKPTEAGTYNIRMKVKDANGTIVVKDATVTVQGELNNTSKVSATSIKLGNTVKVTAAANGGSGKYTYAVYYKKTSNSAWTTAQDYGTNKTVTIKPAAATSYNVRVKVKDSNGMVVNKDFTVKVTK